LPCVCQSVARSHRWLNDQFNGGGKFFLMLLIGADAGNATACQDSRTRSKRRA
jgi:hypothetical protein